MEFNNPIVGEEELIRSAIRSQNYVAGTSGWRIAADGTAEFTGITINSENADGSVTIENGEITIRRSSDNAIVAQVTTDIPQFLGDDGGFYAIDPATQNIAALYGEALQFARVGVSLDRAPAVSWDFVTSTNPDTPRLKLESGRQVNTQNYGLLFVDSSNDTNRAAVTAIANTGSVDDFAFQCWGDANVLRDIQLFRNLVIQGVDQGIGLKDYQAIVANTGTVTTTETVGITSSSVTFEDGRAYKVHVHGLLQSSIAADRARSRTRRTNAAGTILMDTMDTVVIPANNTNVIFDYSQVVVNNSGSDITDVLVVTYHRIAGTGNVRIAADATNPAWIEIKDVGLASDYLNARAL